MSYAAAAAARAEATSAGRAQEQADNRQKLMTVTTQDRAAEKQSQQTTVGLLKDIRKSVAETDEISTRTLETVQSQTEQIDRIKRDQEDIEHNLDTSAYLLRGMRRWGWVQNLFGGPPQPKAGATSSAAPPRPSPVQSSGSKVDTAPPAGLSKPTFRPADRLLAEEEKRKQDPSAASNGQPLRPDQRDAEEEKLLHEIGNSLDGLKAKAQETNRTLDYHNKVLPEIGDRMEVSKDRMRIQNDEMKKLAR
mmetsp:Transcript_29535/g.68115  ORF Transcript_29535/g.68115 Transcript_29535/m.68115 type:complete len:249 (+) Transcript_29535:51-797(+)